MIEIFLISLALACKALADTLAWHYDWFIKRFPKLNTDFWKINVVEKKVKKIANYPVDAWHIANSLQTASWLSLAFKCKYTPSDSPWYVDLGIAILLPIIAFNYFFNKVFIKK